MSFATAYPVVRAFEGGVVDDPRDPGGPTHGGVTQPAYDEWRARNGLPLQPIGQIAPHEIEAVYRMYWDDVRGDAVQAAGGPLVALIVFDAGVNQGRPYARKLLQWAVAVPQDGVIGPRTLGALRVADPALITRALLWGRAGRYVATVRAWRRAKHRDPAWALGGWWNRLDALWQRVDPAPRPALALVA